MTKRWVKPRPPVDPSAIAAPRRHNLMQAPVLSHGADAPARDGALDYAAIPSLINGKRVPFRADAMLAQREKHHE